MSSFTPDELEFLASLFDAARQGRDAFLSDALASGLPPNLTNTNGDTLLILAAYHGRSDAVRVLLQAGADTERVNDRGQTALASAVFRQDAAIVQQLLDAGADPHTGERSAVSIAEFFNLDAMRELLRSAGRDEDGAPTAPQA